VRPQGGVATKTSTLLPRVQIWHIAPSVGRSLDEPCRGWSSSDADAVPGIDRRSRALPVLFTVEVDGDDFAVRRSVDGATDYECVSNPAFGTSASPEATRLTGP
jgi:hypothetical protein